MAVNGDSKKGFGQKKHGPMAREKRGTLGCILRLKRRISHSFGRMLSREDIILPSDHENENVPVTMVIQNGYSDDFLDDVTISKETNGNIQSDISSMGNSDNRNTQNSCGTEQPLNSPQQCKPELVKRQWSETDGGLSESQIISEPSEVHLRQRKPPRPKSECILSNDSSKSYRFSAYRGASPFGKTDTYVKLEQLGEGSYATVYKGISNLNNKIVALKEIRLLEEEGTPFTAIREV